MSIDLQNNTEVNYSFSKDTNILTVDIKYQESL